MSKQIKTKDLVTEGRMIQEKFTKRMVNEFSPMGEIHTVLEVHILNGVEKAFPDYIPSNTTDMISKRILQGVTKIAEKYEGTLTQKYSPATIEWNREMEKSEFDKIYNELQSSVEKMFNTNLFEFYTGGYLYKSTGILGTSISRGKITKWFTKTYSDPSSEGRGSSFGEGDKYMEKYRKFLENLSTARSRFDSKKIRYKIGEVMSAYFAKNPQVVVKKIDWLEDVKPQIEKLYK